MFRAAAIDIRHIPFQSMLDWSSIRELMRDLKEESVGAIVIAQSFGVAYAAVLARKLAGRRDIKIYMTLHRTIAPRSNLFWRKVMSALDGIFFSSAVARDIFKSAWRSLPIPAERLHVIHNSLYLPPQPTAEEPKGPIVVMFHGAIVARSGLETLLDALPALKGKRIRLWIVGKGNPDYIDTLRRRAINADTMNMITWKVGYGESIDHLLSQAHIGVFPYSAKDSFGYPNLEFMAAGLPQIINSTPIAAEYFGLQGGAMFVSPDDKTALAQSILTLASDAALRRKMGAQAAARYAATLSFNKFIEKTLLYIKR
jgi:glycosyltransferase involved in cell wall biosynthesis